LIQAVLALAMARIQLARYSFEQLSKRLGANAGTPVNVAEPEFLRRVSYAIGAAANHVPWRADCFPQCIAARSILSNRGIASTIHLGVERIGENDLAGHAWLTCGDTVVAGGGADLDRFTELHRYPG
jgi:hypothetical protein